MVAYIHTAAIQTGSWGRFRLLPPVERPHLCTCIDKLAHWPEGIPISDITAKTVAQAFVRSLPQDLVFLPLSLQTVDVSLSQICGKSSCSCQGPNTFGLSLVKVVIPFLTDSLSVFIASSRQLWSPNQSPLSGQRHSRWFCSVSALLWKKTWTCFPDDLNYTVNFSVVVGE